jgi:Tfp pilus assembly protein PilF
LLTFVSFVVASSGCRGAPDSLEVRERAYRANNRGIALLERFEYAEAAAAFREALAADQTLGIAHLNLSLALLYNQDLPAADREAAEAARLLPDAPAPAYVRSLIARADNRPDDALRELERVRGLDADDPGTNVNLGQLFLEQRRYEEAMAVLRRAVSLEPYNVTAVYNLGLALTRAGREPEGRDALSRAQALRSVGYAVTYGNGYLEQGRYAQAVASTGAEPELVDAAASRAMFTAAVVAPVPGAGGGVALLDADEDGDLDIYAASPAGDRLFRNEGAGRWTDVTATALGAASGEAVGAVAGDYDNDGRTDLFVLRSKASTLLRNEGNGRFANAAVRAGLQVPNPPATAAWADLDHDGDVDLVVGSPSSGLRLMRNNGDGTFADTTRDTGLQAPGAAVQPVAVAPTDFDNRRDLDLLVVNAAGRPMLFGNRRDGTFQDVAAVRDTGLAEPGLAGRSSAAIGDINKDDYPDFVFFGSDGEAVLALSDGRDRFRAAPAPGALRGATAGQLFDYDNDGLLDLVAWSASGGRVVRNLGGQWADVTSAAMPSASTVVPENPRSVAVGDLDGNGASDLVVLTASGLSALMNRGDPDRQSQRVQLRGRVGNRSGIGAKVQVRAGSLSARAETSAATPSIAPADVVFGLGARSSADAVRVLWPSGILQSEIFSASSPPPAAPASRTLTIEELDRKPSSCPFLFTWNGERFEFVTDFLGAGEMGYWEAPGARNVPDPIEYVRIGGDQLRPRDGRLELRITNELEETLFLDRAQLLAVDHPSDVEVHPNEGMTSPPKPYRLFATADRWTPAAADDSGRDMTTRIAAIDRSYPDDFPLEPIRGYAKPHALTLDLGAGLAQGHAADVLLLTAWTDYAFSSDNVAASHAGLTHLAPALDVRDAHGRWRRAIEQIGLPVGRPQTVPVSLAGILRPGERMVRIVTSMRVYWDRIAIARAVPVEPISTTALDPAAAVLRARGFSAEMRPNGTGPLVYDYARVTPHSPWKVMIGRYTRAGDVKELMVRSDDMFVIAAPGDEVALQFEASGLPSLRDGWTRTFLLFADGYSKEMDINSATPDHVEPLPFHGMTAYPYPAGERYPDTPEHRRYQETFNTRVIGRSVPRLTSP